MAQPERLKRRILSQAFDENVAVIERRLPETLRRRNLWAPARVRLVVMLSLPVLAFAGALALRADLRRLIAAADAVALFTRPEKKPEAADPRRFDAPPVAVDSSVFPLVVRRIVIDPGHGGDSPGTITRGGLAEKDVVLDIGLRLRELLAAGGFEVEMTRTTDTAVELKDRVAFANRVEGDLFLSIHINWIATRERGIETYYLGATTDPYLTALAGQENQDSGYSMAQFRDLLDGLYQGLRRDESRVLAEHLQTAMWRSLRQVNPAIRNRGIKTAPFVVLIDTQMPAVLAEVSCLSHEEEAALLAKPLYRQYIAEALARGIGSFAESNQAPAKPKQEQGT